MSQNSNPGFNEVMYCKVAGCDFGATSAKQCVPYITCKITRSCDVRYNVRYIGFSVVRFLLIKIMQSFMCFFKEICGHII